MTKTKKAKEGICAFCGSFGKVTRDHIPPQNLFLGYSDEGLIKVPGCDDCNQGSKLDDEYFRAFLVRQETVLDHPQAKKLKQHTQQKSDASPRKGLEVRMFQQLHPVRVLTPQGIDLGFQQAIYPEYSRIHSVLKKVVKGLFYTDTGRVLPPNYYVAVFDTKQVEEFQRWLKVDLGYWINALSNQAWTDIYSIFAYRSFYAEKSKMPTISACHLRFFESRQFFGITYPSAIAREFELLDPIPGDNTPVSY